MFFVALRNYRMLRVGSLTDTSITAFADFGPNGYYCSGNSISQLKNVVFPSGKF